MIRPSAGARRRASATMAAALLLAFSGCSLLGRSGGGPAVGPAAADGAGDTVRDSTASPEGGAGTVSGTPAGGTPPADAGTPAPAAPDSGATPADTAAAPPADAVKVEASDQVQFELSDRERDELLAQATQTLTDIRKRLDKLDRNALSPDRLEKLRTIESLVRNAEDAMADDVRASVTLSRKARLLLDDIVVP